MMELAIVIPVFNQSRYTLMCLDSLRQTGVAESQILVIDNGSTDDTPACLARHPGVRVIQNPSNLGCGAAWSQGARAMPAQWTMLLNNDVLAPLGWLEGLRSFAEENGFDVVSPAVGNGEADYDFPAYARAFMQRMANVKRTGVASGVCFMVHRRVFEAVGHFDDELGGYADDEFFRRCRQAGFRLAITGRSFLHHFGSVTQKAIKASRGTPEASLDDRQYYRRKYRLTWLKRKRSHLQDQFRSVRWRLGERARYGCTLTFWREDGKFVWS
jgi:GT2 family glycosyltransferase